ncbi:SnoaL-like protein [Stackebrandtia endophytica]|uniref:SnoaL-like protein n=1 Tax=Stackebrandtia endophytica TaxID=1496996 RepID=A0A543AXF1_9ACTN|nr:nuclear transport factor 2 family protein [Stackebrandtia endophytica]TQL77249.1 SnoaL-like protein [Stackebrandtia endophytica]
MTDIQLPPPVERLMNAVNDSDMTGFLQEFTNDGVVEDWGRRFVGLDEIRDWSDRESIGLQQTFKVTRVHRDGDVVEAVINVGGNGFNGPSTFRFRLEGDRVKEMTISA